MRVKRRRRVVRRTVLFHTEEDQWAQEGADREGLTFSDYIRTLVRRDRAAVSESKEVENDGTKHDAWPSQPKVDDSTEVLQREDH